MPCSVIHYHLTFLYLRIPVYHRKSAEILRQKKLSCRHIKSAIRHMWRMATRLENAEIDETFFFVSRKLIFLFHVKRQVNQRTFIINWLDCISMNR
jgi:hypothetical protein